MRANIYNRLKAGDAKRATTMVAAGRSVEDIAGELELNAGAVQSYLDNSAASADRKAQTKEPDKEPAPKAKAKAKAKK